MEKEVIIVHCTLKQKVNNILDSKLSCTFVLYSVENFSISVYTSCVFVDSASMLCS